MFKELDDKFYNTNLAATVLFSDGLYNKGSHPLYYPFSEKYPIYTVGLGDTTLRSDLYFYDTRINEIAFLGNLFPIEIGLAAKKLLGETTVVELWKGGKKGTRGDDGQAFVEGKGVVVRCDIGVLRRLYKEKHRFRAIC